jgi:hypothetical protein
VIATSRTRVPSQTDQSVNARIEQQTRRNIDYFRAHPEKVDERLRELDEEWDVERMLETGSSCLSLLGLGVSALSGRRRWLILPLAVQGFFLQHALQGWCPPLPVLRRLGFRTVEELDRERCALREISTGAQRQSQARRPRQEVI